MEQFIKLIETIGNNPWLIVIILILAFAFLLRSFGKGQNAQAESLETLRQAFNDYREDKAKELGKLTAKVDINEKEIDGLRNAVRGLELQVEQVKLERDTFKERLAAKEAELERVLGEMRKEIEAAVQRVTDSFAAEIRQLTEERDRLTTQVKDKQQELQAKTDELDRARAAAGPPPAEETP